MSFNQTQMFIMSVLEYKGFFALKYLINQYGSSPWDTNKTFVKETEARMELESWMTNEKTWNSKDIAIETELTLENWMLDSEVWN